MSEPDYDLIEDKPGKPKRGSQKKFTSFLRQRVDLSLSVSTLVFAGGVIGVLLIIVLALYFLSQRLSLASPLDLESTPEPDSVPACTAVPLHSTDGRIVFSAAVTGQLDLYVIQPDRRNLCRLTDHSGNSIHASWVLNGQQIIYGNFRDDNSTYEVQVVNADGTQSEKLLIENGGFDVAASPDGRLIAYTALNEIFLQETTETLTAYQLTNTTDIPERTPIWSPDNRFLAYSGSGSISLMDVECARQTRSRETCVTHSFPLPVEKEVGSIELADWSPDGRSIIFNYQLVDYQSADRIIGVYSIDVDGTNMRLLTDPSRRAFDASWSPNGKEIVFTGVVLSDNNTSLFILNLETGGVRRLTPAMGASSPDWG